MLCVWSLVLNVVLLCEPQSLPGILAAPTVHTILPRLQMKHSTNFTAPARYSAERVASGRVQVGF